MIPAPGKIVRLGVLIAFGGLATTGCASPFSDVQVDPASPIAEAVRAARVQKGHRPTFADIPPIPTDVRGPARFKAVMVAEKAAADQLIRETAPDTFKLHDTEAFAAVARAEAKAPDLDAPTDADRADTEAFAKAARGRASAPSSKPK